MSTAGRLLPLLVLWGCAPVPGANIADTLPALASDAAPFRYPLALYEQRIEGDVTLRIHVDSTGAVVPESLRIAESSGQPQLDSAAMQGAPSLLFRPARLGGRAVALTVLFPVKFRVPVARPTVGDSAGDSARIPDS